LINTLTLFLFSYGKQHQQQHCISRSLKLLENLPAEQNNITEDFVTLGLKINNAFESQALLELKNNFCIIRKAFSAALAIRY